MKRRGKAPKRAKKRGRKPAELSTAGPAPFSHQHIGLAATVERVVPHEWTIQSFNQHLPPVFSTPAMIGLMEHASVMAILPHMPTGAISVGTRIEVDHLKAVPDGALVHASAKLVGYRGRFMVFEVEARSGNHLIGRGRVFRAIVHPVEHGAKARDRV